MRYLVTARVKPGRERALLAAIENGSLGQGSVAGDEYLRNMTDARLREDSPGREGKPELEGKTVRWVEVCFCRTPLEEERPYWEEYFELVKVQDAHARHKCRDETGQEPWACGECDCTERLEARLKDSGKAFLEALRESAS